VCFIVFEWQNPVISILCNDIEGSTVLDKQKTSFFAGLCKKSEWWRHAIWSTYINSQERKYKNENLVKRYSSSVPFYEKDLGSPENFSLWSIPTTLNVFAMGVLIMTPTTALSRFEEVLWPLSPSKESLALFDNISCVYFIFQFRYRNLVKQIITER